VQATAPSRDALVTGSSVDVTLQATDLVGLTALTVNSVPATRTSGTPQTGTWRVTVPVTLPVPAGGALRFEASAVDAGGNVGAATLLVDNDGIPAALDRSRSGGVDLSSSYSSDFNNGTTAGTMTRNGWTTRLSAAPTAGGVRTTVSGTGTSSMRISACVGVPKEVRLDVAGETADVTCNPTTGTITVKAISAAPQVELREQLESGAWQQFNLLTGQSMSVGSPAAASRNNTAPIAVQLLQLDDAGRETVVGGYELAPGAIVDVSVTPDPSGRDIQIGFRVLAGTVPVNVRGLKRTVRPGESATMRMRRGR
jgi:hypothetical protein